MVSKVDYIIIIKISTQIYKRTFKNNLLFQQIKPLSMVFPEQTLHNSMYIDICVKITLYIKLLYV
jgi:hypothetical protein